MTKLNELFFCRCPWETMYYHIDEPSPCHLIRHGMNFTPLEYLKSDWLKNIKTQFVNGEVPEPCQIGCKSREDLGLKSTRGAAWGYYNVGEIPDIDISQYTVEKETVVKRLELRTSNLCNFKCRMCTEDSSSEVAKEKMSHDIPLYFSFTRDTDKSVHNTTVDSFEELKQIALDGVNYVCFTGGEPFLIKQYYSFMDHLIENGLHKKIKLELFTNCSTYNPEFMDRMLQFDRVEFVMSIDAVGKTAEYQRSGTKWDVVEKNILKFVTMDKNIYFNTAITSYVLLDVSSLAKFLMRLHGLNPNIKTKCYTVNSPPALHFRNLSPELRAKAIQEINDAVGILVEPNFVVFKQELLNIKYQLENTFNGSYEQFVEYTKGLDTKRNESFKEVFGYEL